jgi:UPF0755 protein
MKLKILFIAILLFTFCIILITDLIFFHKHYRSSFDEITITVQKGEGLRKIAEKLDNAELIFNVNLFVIAGKITGYENGIIPGEYKFSTGYTNIDILKILTDVNFSRGINVTIPEGLTIKQIARIFSRQLNVDSATFVMIANNDSLIKSAGIDAKNLEGYLFPDTYQFSYKKANLEKEIVLTMLNQFRRKVDKNILDNINKNKLNLRDVIIMASIIEGETRYIPEMKVIAGVYYNRLRKKMRLEADPTVQYALPDGPKKRLVYSDLKINSPYNTYLNSGLPPGPINNPGMNAILAAINPDNHTYLYFVAKGDGSHKFASTYEEHKKNVSDYRKFLDGQNK